MLHDYGRAELGELLLASFIEADIEAHNIFGETVRLKMLASRAEADV
ncbi:MAG: hypothetical protein J0H41_16785 [Rhizobiales bacterium]|nr:hypothetical protein [Hyphomicrobiales bacterium]